MSMYYYKKNIWLITVSLLLLLVTASKVAGADEQFDAGETDPKNVALKAVQRRMFQRVSVDFRETPIEDVLRSMAQQADIDIIKSPKVMGNVTATLTNIPLNEALANILSVHGYAFITSENMVKVVSISEVATEEKKFINRVYRITYANVEDVYNALKSFVSNNGSIAYNKGTSHLMVTETESKMAAIDTFIEEVDRVTAQIMVEARIYDITSTDRFDLGVEWQAGRNTTYSGASGIETRGSVTGRKDPHLSGLFSGAVNKATDTDALIRFGILNGALNIDAIIRAEKEKISAKLLANPRILVLDNEKALIRIVEEIPFQELTQTAQAGNIGTTEFRDVGVELTVIPHVTRDNLIRLSLNPKFSINTGDVVLPGVNNASPQPIIATREAITTALIEDGQTVVIGGMRKQDVSNQVNKVPLLGDIPLLGFLFRFEGEKDVVNELVVFITPHIVAREMMLTPLEIQQYEDTKVPAPQSPTSGLDITNEQKVIF